MLRSRNRSAAKVTKGIRCTLNPDENHFVIDWVRPYLDEEGYPIKELSGKTRYYVFHEDKLYTDWDEKVLRDRFNKKPQTYTYILSLLSDNEHLMKSDPEYKDNLDSMGERKRKQLLLGCWSNDDDSGMYWRRSWLKKASHVPLGCSRVRGYDLAATEPNKDNPSPDFTASIQLWKDRAGYYYIAGNYVDHFKDPDSEIIGKFRKRSGERDNIMLSQAEQDGAECAIILPEDAGAAGKEAFESKVRFFAENGFRVIKDASKANLNKLSKFEPFATACEHGLVYIIETSFTPDSLEAFYKELEMFDNLRSSARKKDDWVDACASAFNSISKVSRGKLVARNQARQSTEIKHTLESYRNTPIGDLSQIRR